MSAALLTRETARAGLSLAQAGGLPARRGELTAAPPAARAQRSLADELMPGLANYLRPQSAFQWWTLPYLSSITPQYVQNVLIGGLAGNHVACWQLFDLMIDTNPEIAACVGEFVDGICAKKLIIEPYHEEDEPPSENAVRNQKLVAAALRNMAPDPAADENGLKQTIRDIVFSRFFGPSALEVDYYKPGTGQQLHTLDVANIGTIVAPRCTFWVHPVCYAWDMTGRMGLRIPEANLRDVSRNARTNKAGSLPPDYGSANGLSFSGYSGAQRTTTVTPFPKNQFLIAAIKAKAGSMLGASALRPLANWWVFENFSADFAMDLAQIFGIPFRVAHYAPTTTDKDKQFVADMLQNMGSRGWALLPDGIKLEFEKAMATGADSPQGFLIKLCQEQYRKVILRQTMTGSGHGGAAQGSKGGMETEQDVKSICLQSAADFAAEVLREQFARAILRLNVGDDSEAPFIRLTEEKEGDLGDMQRDQIGAQLIDLGEDYFRRKYGYPKLAPGEKKAAMPAAPAFGTPPGSPAGPTEPPKTGADDDSDEPTDEETQEELEAAIVALDAAESDGQWITVNGRHIMLKDGESADDAVKRTFDDETAKPGDSEKTKTMRSKLAKLRQENGERAKQLADTKQRTAEHERKLDEVKHAEPNRELKEKVADLKDKVQKTEGENKAADQKIAREERAEGRGQRPAKAIKVSTNDQGEVVDGPKQMIGHTRAAEGEYFHGTSPQAADEILKHGINPTDKTLGIKAAFVGQNKGLAQSYGAGAAATANSDEVAVIVVKHDGKGELYAPKGAKNIGYNPNGIRPSQIDRVEYYKRDGGKDEKPTRVVYPKQLNASAPEQLDVGHMTVQQLAEALSADLDPVRHAIAAIEAIEDPKLFEQKLRELIAEHGPLVKLLADINAYPKAAGVINDVTTKHLAEALKEKPETK